MIQPTSGVTYADYWGAIKNGNFTHIRMTFTGQNIVLTDEDIELTGGITIQDLVNSDADLHIGKAVCRQFTAHIFNSNKLNGINWFGEFQFEMGVEINGTTQWVTVGYFKGEKPKKVVTVDVIEFTAYDRMKLFDAPAKDFIDSYIATMDSGSISYVSMETLFHDMCTHLGIGYNNGDANDNINTAEYRSYIKKVSGCTYREILGYMAETCGCYARIDNVGNAKFIWFTDYNHAITANEEYNVEFDEIQVPSITCIKIQPYNKETFMKYPENGAETSVYYIKQNPIIVATEYQQTVFERHMKRIYDMLTGIGTYTPTTIECIGCWLVEAGDIITASVDGQDVSIPIFNKTMHWAGNIVDQYELTGDMQRSVDYDMNDPVQQTALQILDRIASPATRNDLLDEVLDTGFYYFASANIGGESTSGVIYSVNGSNTSYQLAITLGGRLFFRRVTSNYIGTWKEFLSFDNVENDLIATDEGKALDARQGKIIADDLALKLKKIVYTGTNKISSFDDIELGTWGRVTLTAAVSPSGDETTGNYICVGSNANYRSILFWAQTRQYMNTCYGGTWNGWFQQVSETTLTVSSSGNTFTIESGSRIAIDVIGASNNRNGAIMIYCQNNGTINYNVLGCSSLTVTMGTNKMTISGGAVTLYCRIHAGSITKDTTT